MNTIVKNMCIGEKNQKEIFQDMEFTLSHSSKNFRIITVNLEYIGEARKNKNFYKSLCHSEVMICDSIGVWLIQKIRAKKVFRIPGADFAWDIVSYAEKHKKKVFFAVNSNGLSQWRELDRMIHRNWPRLKYEGEDILPREVVYKSYIISSKLLASDVVLCNFGIPEQEYFLDRIRRQKKGIVLMGVGGTFDFWTGKQKRAPKWMRRCGFEWFWRFLCSPRRSTRFLKRIF